MRCFLVVALGASLVCAGTTGTDLGNRWTAGVNALGPATFGLGAAVEYGSRNALTMEVTAGNTSIPVVAALTAQGHPVSYFGGGAWLGYARYFSNSSPLDGFFLRPSAGISYFSFDWNKADFFDTDMEEWTPPVDLFYVTVKSDIGRRWTWKNGVFMGSGVSLGAAFQVDKLDLTPVAEDEKDAEAWLTVIPWLELILEVGYRF